MGSAQRKNLKMEMEALPLQAQPGLAVESMSKSEDLRAEVAERLRAHRERRSRGAAAAVSPADAQATTSKTSSIAAAVAERFAQTPSYRAILAEQARIAMEEAAQQARKAAAEAESAAADAEVARRNARAIAQAQVELMAELDLWNAPQAFTAATAQIASPAVVQASQSLRDLPEARPLTIRMHQQLTEPSEPPVAIVHQMLPTEEEAQALEAEIAFRQAPVFEIFETLEPATTIPANLLSFPRQLIAPRKARPTSVEGPLQGTAGSPPQLRIFEVEDAQISTTPTPPAVSPVAMIHLDAHTIAERVVTPLPLDAATQGLPRLEPAALNLRLMAASVDAILVGASFLASVAVLLHVAQFIPSGLAAWLATAATLLSLGVAYKALFYAFAGQTPGMRYASIGFCTFEDGSPTRRALLWRIPAQALAVAPLGLGLAWALLDPDHLGWHDRLTRMYARAY